MLYLLGPDDCIENDNSIGVRRIGRSETEECDGKPKRDKGVDGMEDGNVIYSYDNGLQPTDVAQYTVITNISKTGTYLVRAKYGPADLTGITPIDQDISRITVYCSPECLFDRHQDLILGVSALLVGLLGVIFASDRARTSLYHGIVHVYNTLCNTLTSPMMPRISRSVCGNRPVLASVSEKLFRKLIPRLCVQLVWRLLQYLPKMRPSLSG